MRYQVTRALVLSLLVGTTMTVGALADHARPLPDFSLRDPAGRLHTRESLASRGLVLVVTAPVLASQDDQRAWDAHLRAARPEDAGARLAFSEDLAQSWFPGRALAAMREAYDPDEEPVLLLDARGRLRRALKVDEGLTVLVAFDAVGSRRYCYSGSPSAAAARRAWAAAGRDPPGGPPLPVQGLRQR